MACRATEVNQYGYEDCRFEKDVDEHFHCSICYNVLKEPRMCRNNEHIFCLDCITKHLNVNSQTCPECNEHLSVETLRRAPRVVNNYLSELKMNCDYADRGCPEFVRVEDLKTHVENCGFAPTLCSNDGCCLEINKQERIQHETTLCEYRKVKCHDCGRMHEVVGRLEGRLMELHGKVEATNNEMKNNHVDMRKVVGKLEEKVEATKNEMKNNNLQVKKVVGKLEEKVGAKLEASFTEMKNNHVEVKQVVEAKFTEVNDKVEAVREEMTNEVKDVQENLSKVNKDVNEVKVMMSQMLEKLNMLEQLNKLPSPSEKMLNTPREDILIASDWCTSSKSTEIYSWEKNSWIEVSPMNEHHRGASSFIYKDQLFVVGGRNSATIETLDLNKLPLKWGKFPGELPNKCNGHKTVVYQENIIHICGYNNDVGRLSNVISELQLTSPCILKELCRMPEQRDCHGAEIFEDKVLILGGHSEDDGLDSVLEFDAKKNKVKKMPPLPCALTRMATVRWRDNIVVLGGQDEKFIVFNDVYMYDCKTGEITALPCMLEKRFGCCAVITGNTIVVMGGVDENDEPLSSVECFTMGGSAWEYLPAMNQASYRAVAEVLPSGRKYV